MECGRLVQDHIETCSSRFTHKNQLYQQAKGAVHSIRRKSTWVAQAGGKLGN